MLGLSRFQWAHIRLPVYIGEEDYFFSTVVILGSHDNYRLATNDGSSYSNFLSSIVDLLSVNCKVWVHL